MNLGRKEPNKWTVGIAETFLSVLGRPKFGFEIGELKWTAALFARATIKADGDSFLFSISESLHCATVTLEEDWRGETAPKKFRFKQTFSKMKTQKVRQKALICAKKLEAKGTYDVLNM